MDTVSGKVSLLSRAFCTLTLDYAANLGYITRVGRRKKNNYLKKTAVYFIQTFSSLPSLFKDSFFHPKEYAKTVARKKDLFLSLLFFLISVFIWKFGDSVIEFLPNLNHFPFTFVVLDILIKIPVIFLFVLFLSLILWGLAKLLKGTATYKQTLCSCLFAASPLCFFWIKILIPVFLLWVLLLMIYNFRRAQKYSLLSAYINIVIPAAFFILIFIFAGVGSSLL